MSRRLIDMLMGLSGRERVLLGVGIGVVLPVVVVLGGLLPLQEQRSAAERAQTEAIALQEWVLARVGEKQALTRQNTPGKIGPPIGSAGIEEGLIAAQLRRSVSALGTVGQGGIELRFDQVDFLKLVTWLGSSHPGWGYEIAEFRLDASETSGVVAAWLSLVPKGQ